MTCVLIFDFVLICHLVTTKPVTFPEVCHVVLDGYPSAVFVSCLLKTGAAYLNTIRTFLCLFAL